MPAINESSIILLTGASGFLAAHVGRSALKKGLRVRGTVRSEAKGEYLKKLYEKEGLKGFEYVIVEDIEPDGAFDEAVKGVDGVAHTASPFHTNTDDPMKDLINPAVQGTRGLLKSAAKEPKIKRVVITSSFAAVMNPRDSPFNFTEAEWNEPAVEHVKKEGKNSNPMQAYCASKTMAEKAGWSFIETEKPSFDLAVINPPYIFGEIIHQCHSAKSLNTSVAGWYAYLNGDKSDEDAPKPAGQFADVEDVASLHVEALLTPEASNKRFLVANSTFTYQQFLDTLRSSAEGKELLKSFPKAVKGVPNAEEPKQNTIDTTRAQKTFNWKPIPLEKTVVEMTRSLAERQKEW